MPSVQIGANTRRTPLQAAIQDVGNSEVSQARITTVGTQTLSAAASVMPLTLPVEECPSRWLEELERHEKRADPSRAKFIVGQ